MDTFVFSLVAVVAIVMLGALISIGNNRQRKALDAIRQQIEGWASQDILLKREKLAREIHAPDAIPWFARIAANATGVSRTITGLTPFSKNGATAVVAACNNGQKLVFTPIQHDEFVRIVTPGKGRGILAGADTSILGVNPKKASHYELSVLNSGMFFDIEAAKVWQAVTGEAMPKNTLTMYEVG